MDSTGNITSIVDPTNAIVSQNVMEKTKGLPVTTA